MSKYFLLVLLLCSFGHSFSQGFEEKLLDAFFDHIVREDCVLSIKRHLGEIYPVIDPITGRDTIIYPKILGHYDSIFIKDYSEEVKNQILYSWWPVPVLKDTICIIDTNTILGANYDKNKDGHNFKVLSYNKYLRRYRHYNQYEMDRKSFDTLNTTYFYLQDIGIRRNTLCLNVSIEGSCGLLQMNFDVSDGVKFLRYYIFDPRHIYDNF